MRVSLSGSDLTFAIVRRIAVGVVAVFVVLCYLYGPAASPAMRNQAVRRVQRARRGQLAQLPAELERRRLPALDLQRRQQAHPAGRQPRLVDEPVRGLSRSTTSSSVAWSSVMFGKPARLRIGKLPTTR